MSLITKEQFSKCISLIQRLYQKEDEINAFLKRVCEEGYCEGVYTDAILTIEELLIDMLEPAVVSPDESLIGYFIYELDFGKNKITYQPEFINYEITTDTDISDASKLYDFLQNKYQYFLKEKESDERIFHE